MAGTRTAPDVTGAATRKRVSVRTVDFGNDLDTQTITVAAAAPNAQAEALVAAHQAASNGSVYQVNISSEWVGAKSPGNAQNEPRAAVQDGAVFFYKDIANDNGRDYRVPAIEAATIDAGTENIDPTNALIADVKTALDALLSGFTAQTVRLTEKQDINNAIPF